MSPSPTSTVGGPGGGTSPADTVYFNPDKYKVRYQHPTENIYPIPNSTERSSVLISGVLVVRRRKRQFILRES
jgi:hypothetical protein